MQTKFADAAQHADAFFVIRAISTAECRHAYCACADISCLDSSLLRQNSGTSALLALNLRQQSEFPTLADGLQHILAKKMAPHMFTEPTKIHCG